MTKDKQQLLELIERLIESARKAEAEIHYGTAGSRMRSKRELAEAEAALQAHSQSLLVENERLREGLQRIAKVGVGAGFDWSDSECADYWATIASSDRQIARTLLGDSQP